MNMRRLAIVLSLLSLIVLSATLLLRFGKRVTTAPPEAAPERASEEVASPAPAEAPAAEPSAPREVFADWVALGSGCRGRFDKAGDVTMERVAGSATSSDVYKVRFRFERFRLSSGDRAAGAPLDFARECAVRVQLGPPAGKRVKNIVGRTQVISNKGADVKLTLLSELLIGSASLGRSVLVYDMGAAHRAKDDVFELAPDKASDPTLPALKCAERKVLGFDYSWIVERKTAGAEVSVELSGAQMLELEVELTDC